MKWVLLWMSMVGNGAMTSGSAEFANVEACFAAQQAYGGVNFEMNKNKTFVIYSESVCVNSETGEKRSILKPR